MDTTRIREDAGRAVEAFIGARKARELHRYYVKTGATIDAGLDSIESRWPDLKSPSTAEPIFIFAAGWRTGSTFLQRVVMSANDVFIWGEPYHHADVVGSMARQVTTFNRRWPSDEFFLDHFEKSEMTRRWIANLYPSMEDFMASHIACLVRLLEAPAKRRGASRWGMKEIVLTVAHARYLKWLFPRARFLFLYRNPFDAWRSYYRWRNFYRAWPSQPVFTPRKFGDMWNDLTAEFVDRHTEVGGLLLRYEELKSAATKKRLEEYLGLSVADPASLQRLGDAKGSTVRPWAPKLEYALLKRKVGPLADRLGYSLP